jgi:hypothetical protein
LEDEHHAGSVFEQDVTRRVSPPQQEEGWTRHQEKYR